MVMSRRKQAYESFRDLLRSEVKIKELGKAKHKLGVRVEFVKIGISLSQGQCICKSCPNFLFPQRKQGVRPNGFSFGLKKVFGL